MTDRPDTDGRTPPPAPWWSTPGGSDDAWGAPRAGASGDGVPGEGVPPTRPYGAPSPSSGPVPPPSGMPQTSPYAAPGSPYAAPSGTQPPYGEAAYGAPSYGAPAFGAPSGEASPPEFAFPPGSYREPAASPWGTPVDTVGRTPSARRRGLGIAAAVIATALVAGGAGGVIGARTSNGGSLLDPSASLGSSGSTAPTVDRAPGSVAAIAAQVLKSTVSIAVASGSSSGTGSGVVIRSDGYVLTNNHVVASAADGAGRITVTNNSSGTELEAEIVGLDPDTDLAVLKVRGGGQLEPATLGQSASLVVGDPVIAVGSPLGLEGTVTTGIVSALNRSPAVPGENGGRTFLANAIQTDAAINPGNSGGALVDSKGEVIGINSAIATLGGSGGESGSIGIGFAIPIDEARSIAEEIIQTGRVTHPAIGVEAATVTDGSSRVGARISAVAPGSSAERAGLRSGDVLVAVEGTPVTSVDELIVAIREHKVGEKIKITYLRDGSDRRTTTATLQDKRSR